MKEKTVKEKKPIVPNECSLLRWIITVAVGCLAGTVLCIPFDPYLKNSTDTIMGIIYSDFFGILNFIPLFICFILAMRFIAKTSLKDFTLGIGGKVNKKECLIILGLYVLGFALPFLYSIKYISVREVNAGHFAFLVLFMILTTWIQTTFEELIFRGVFLRWACKNKIGYTKKAWIVAIVSSLAFALFHAGNPEVTSQGGWYVVLAVFNYSIPGFLFFWADMHFGSLLPGFIMHWINNFLLFTLISEEISALSVQTLLIDHSSGDAVSSLISVIVVGIPLMIYMIVDIIRKKKAATK